MTSIGAFGETWAVGHITRLGYGVIARNVRFKEGEIDIVACDGECLVFVEVKTRRNRRYGLPEESITSRRYQRLAATIERYIQERAPDCSNYRIDLLSLEMDAQGRVSQHRLLRNLASPAM